MKYKFATVIDFNRRHFLGNSDYYKLRCFLITGSTTPTLCADLLLQNMLPVLVPPTQEIAQNP